MPSSNPTIQRRAEDLARDLAAAEPEKLQKAIEAELHDRATRLANGISAYKDHPYQRDSADPEPFWQDGTTTLVDYGPPTGRPVLIIPSLVNRAYILDLMPEHSLIRHMIQNGLRPILLNWNAPGEVERTFDLTAYIAGRLEQVLDETLDRVGGPVAVLGYCMGGLMAVALATRRKREINRLALIATPWDFHVPEMPHSSLLGALAAPLCTNFSILGELPTDILQCLFTAGDPHLAIRKFSRFADLTMNSPGAIRFVAAEDWLNDGVPLALPVARECLSDWYGNNLPATGNWRVAGRVVNPARYDRPVMIVVPSRDKLVPPQSAAALAAQMPAATVLRPDLGHIGVMVANRAVQAVWNPLTSWLCQ